MTIKLKKGTKTWYFSSGIYVEHMRALYYPQNNTLEVISLRHLLAVMRLLRKQVATNLFKLDLSFCKETK